MGLSAIARTERLDRWTIDGAAAGIHCPVLIVHGERDSQVPVSDARRLLQTASSRLRVFTAEEGRGPHYQNDNWLVACEEVGEWRRASC